MVVEVAFNFSIRAAIPSKNQGMRWDVGGFGFESRCGHKSNKTFTYKKTQKENEHEETLGIILLVIIEIQIVIPSINTRLFGPLSP